MIADWIYRIVEIIKTPNEPTGLVILGLILLLGVIIINGPNSRFHIQWYNYLTLALFAVTQYLALQTQKNYLLVLVATFPLVRYTIVRTLLAYATPESQTTKLNIPASSTNISSFVFLLKKISKPFIPLLIVFLITLPATVDALLFVEDNFLYHTFIFVILPVLLVILYVGYLRPGLEKDAEVQRWLEKAWPQWMYSGEARYGKTITTVSSFALIMGAFLLSQQVFQLNSNGIYDFMGLFVSLALIFTGMFMMINEAGIISHMVGLLVSENGLLLTAIIFVQDDQFLTFVVAFSIFLFVVATIVILAYFIKDLDSLNIPSHRRLGG